MFIGHFNEQPWQDVQEGYPGVFNIGLSDSKYDPVHGAKLYNRFLDEKLYAEEVGFEGLMLNEHHATAFCMQASPTLRRSFLRGRPRRPRLSSWETFSPSGMTRCGWRNNWP